MAGAPLYGGGQLQSNDTDVFPALHDVMSTASGPVPGPAAPGRKRSATETARRAVMAAEPLPSI
eukprot:gene923-5240_t